MLAQVGPSWPHVDSSWFKLASCWLKLAPIVVKGEKPLTRYRVLGLGLEQVLKYMLAGGFLAAACSVVVFEAAAVPAKAWTNIKVGIALNTEAQKGLQVIGNDLFTACQHMGFHVLGVDVAFSNYLGGQHQDKAHDLVGTFMPGGMGPALGPSTAEVLLTTLSQDHAKVKDKMQARIAALALAGAMFASHLFIMIRYEEDEMAGVLRQLDRCMFHLKDGAWEPFLPNVPAVSPVRLTTTQKRFREVMSAMGEPLKTKAKGELKKAYKLKLFLWQCGCKVESDRVVAMLKDKYGLAHGCKKLSSARHGRGGTRKDGQKKDTVWMCSLAFLEKAYPHVMEGFL